MTRIDVVLKMCGFVNSKVRNFQGRAQVDYRFSKVEFRTVNAERLLETIQDKHFS